MADFEIQDEDYHRAQYWLERIIKDYRKTPEFKEAAFLFGKNYYEQKDYERSLQEFETFIRTRGIPKPKKLEAIYYIALNRLEMGSHEKALKEVKYLVRNEERPEMLSRARVLYGRALLAAAEVEKGLEELKAVTTSYPRTESAATAYYYWGNYLYYEEGKIDEAVPHLNRVRTEFAQSPLAEKSTQMAAAINKTKPVATLNSSRDLQAWLDYHYLKAENLFSPLALPDSALAVYQRVINERDSLAVKRDSLEIKIARATIVIDSLVAILPAPIELAEPDSLELSANAEDSLKTDLDRPLPTELDSEPTTPDSIDIALEELSDPPLAPEPELPQELSPPLDQPEDFIDEDLEIEDPISDLPRSDTLDTDGKELPDRPLEPKPDKPEEPNDEEDLPDEDPETPAPEPIKTGSALLQELQRDLPLMQKKVDDLEPLIERFDTQIIPFCYFSMHSLLLELPERAEEAEILYQKMLAEYPRNMYSAAATAIKEGRSPRLVDPAYNEALAAFDDALDSYPNAPDSLVTLMQDYTESEYDDLKLRANYRLGWYYSFEEPDTTLAKEYLSAVLDDPDNADFAPTVRRFYNGTKYLLRDSGLIDSVAVVADSVAVPAAEIEPLEESPADSTFTGPITGEEAIPDSLKFEIELPEEALPLAPLELTEPAVPDSLPDLPTDTGEGFTEPEIRPEGDSVEPQPVPPEAEETPNPLKDVVPSQIPQDPKE
jgi:tetratricopeptide (TPR) repeat protein